MSKILGYFIILVTLNYLQITALKYVGYRNVLLFNNSNTLNFSQWNISVELIKPKNTSILEGTTVKLDCNHPQGTQIGWILPGKCNHDDDFSVDKNGTLIIKKAVKGDSGLYICALIGDKLNRTDSVVLIIYNNFFAFETRLLALLAGSGFLVGCAMLLYMWSYSEKKLKKQQNTTIVSVPYIKKTETTNSYDKLTRTSNVLNIMTVEKTCNDDTSQQVMVNLPPQKTLAAPPSIYVEIIESSKL